MKTNTLTTPFPYGHAGASHWRSAVDACLAQCGPALAETRLGFFYASDAFTAELPQIVAALRADSGVRRWIGSTAVGICATGREYHDEPALAIMGVSVAAQDFWILGADGRTDPTGRRGNGEPAASIGIVHGDPAAPGLARRVKELAGRLAGRFLVGGLSSSRFGSGCFADELAPPGLSGVLFSPEVILATRLTQGCLPLGAVHAVSESQDNLVLRLDGRSALRVFQQDLGGAADSDGQRMGGPVQVGIIPPGGDPDELMVRPIAGFERGSGAIVLGERLLPGSRLAFCRLDRAAASDDLVRMLASIRTGLYHPPRGALYFSCAGRGEGLFGGASHELGIIRDALGEVPLVGFFGSGEIFRDRIHQYGGVLTLFI